MTKKQGLILTSILLSLIITAIIVCCFVFSDRIRVNNNYLGSEQSSPAIEDSSENINLYLGDTYDFSRHVSFSKGSSISYVSSNSEIASINSDGLLSSKKCGEVSIEILDHNVIINSYDVTIDFRHEIVPVSNCTVDENQITLTENEAQIKICLLSTNNLPVFSNLKPELTSTENITISQKMKIIYISATSNGCININYPDINVSFALQISVS